MNHKTVKNNTKNIQNRLRVLVFRSNKHIYCQLFDDDKKKITISFSSLKIIDKVSPIKKATMVGNKLGQYLTKNKIINIYYDRNGYKYHGQVKALADGIRESGIKF